MSVGVVVVDEDEEWEEEQEVWTVLRTSKSSDLWCWCPAPLNGPATAFKRHAHTRTIGSWAYGHSTNLENVGG